MKRDSGNTTSVRCRYCGVGAIEGHAAPMFDDAARRRTEHLGKTYQVIVACSSCGTSFVVLSRN